MYRKLTKFTSFPVDFTVNKRNIEYLYTKFNINTMHFNLLEDQVKMRLSGIITKESHRIAFSSANLCLSSNVKNSNPVLCESVMYYVFWRPIPLFIFNGFIVIKVHNIALCFENRSLLHQHIWNSLFIIINP